MDLRLQIEGIPEIQHDLSEMISKDNISNTLLRAAIIIRGEAKRYCPVMFRKLQASITHRKISDLTYEVAATANYADIIEFGTFRGQKYSPENPLIYTSTSGKYPSYRPFLRSALYDNIDRITALFDKLDEEQGEYGPLQHDPDK